ncbi:MAG: hypothetical protein HQ543_02330 [Bacteroidetes bacterium]|nr:hypothetical protein [Bacteroidota bacterium]
MKTLKDFFKGKKNVMEGPVSQKYDNTPVAEQQNRYQCPMKCEGDKFYSEPGNCPVCNMKLVPVQPHTHTNGKTHNNNHHGCC